MWRDDAVATLAARSGPATHSFVLSRSGPEAKLHRATPKAKLPIRTEPRASRRHLQGPPPRKQHTNNNESKRHASFPSTDQRRATKHDSSRRTTEHGAATALPNAAAAPPGSRPARPGLRSGTHSPQQATQPACEPGPASGCRQHHQLLPRRPLHAPGLKPDPVPRTQPAPPGPTHRPPAAAAAAMPRCPGSALRRQEALPVPPLATACGVTLLRAA